MAIVKHIASKNSNYSGAVEYLTKQFDEKLNKPILDSNGYLQERENYRISYTNPDGEQRPIEEWEADCIRTNMKYGQNTKKNEIKSHMYIVSFDPKDNLTIDQVQELTEEIAAEHFKGYSYLVAAHGNDAHIVLNSAREKELEKQDYMKHKNKSGEYSIPPCEYVAGGKHNCSGAFLHTIKARTMELCRENDLSQVDLFNPAAAKKSENENYAERRAAAKGKITQKEYCRQVIDYAKAVSRTPEEYLQVLKDYNVEVEKRGEKWRYKPVEASKWIRDKSLGADYIMSAIMREIAQNKGKTPVKEAKALQSKLHEARHRIELNPKEPKQPRKQQELTR